jgi:cryptochrome
VLSNTDVIHQLGTGLFPFIYVQYALLNGYLQGARVFDEYLLDADWSLNNGNWLWLSASAFFHQFFRVYSPVSFPQKTDKTGNYVRRYLPVLKDIPDQYIYEPWKAPLDIQRRAKCIVGVDYPARICDFAEAKQRAMDGLKEAYEVRRSGVVYSNQQLVDLAAANRKLWGQKSSISDTKDSSAVGKKRQRSIGDFFPDKKK